MGPANTKLCKGRGDATKATKKIGDSFENKETVLTLLEKYELLTEEEQQELSDILKGEDVEELLMDRGSLSMFLMDLSDYQ